MQKLFLRLGLLITVIGIFCVAPFAQAQEESVQIDFYWASSVEGNLPAIFEEYANQFMAENPGVTVKVVYTGSYTQTRDTILAEGVDPIVDVSIMLATDLSSFISDSYIIPLTPFIEAMGEDGQAYIEDFFPAFLANGVDAFDTVWSIPFQRSTPILFYNADLLAENSLEVPTNNEELIAVAQALTTEDRYGFLLPVAGTFPIWIYQSFAAAYGKPVVDNDLANVYFNTPETLAAVDFMTRVGLPMEEGGFGIGPRGGSAWGETPTAFVSGQAAMIYHTTGSLTSILANVAASENPFEVGVAFLPSGPAGEDGTGYGAPTGGGNLYIFDSETTPKTEAELDAAWRWVLFLSSPEVQSDWGAQTGYIASNYSAWEIEPLLSLAEEFPQYGVARDQLEFAVKEFDAFRSVDIQNIINLQLSRIISGEVSLDNAEAALIEGQAQIDALLEPFQND
ncbi:MAG: ABC transporter substrate-binding protein [Phototrophicales bacterium]|nr:ABC transporter substrate-binding protein [Phototrophicales bacterium]